MLYNNPYDSGRPSIGINKSLNICSSEKVNSSLVEKDNKVKKINYIGRKERRQNNSMRKILY
jgi:hypothetical protein